ncbi:MAG TPA: hypothetical protein VKP52_05475 [Pseudolabrys sp.]|nr:hypothetical protein [Pseudolabrys sp.]
MIAVTPYSEVVLRSNANALWSFAEDLKEIADEVEARPGPDDTTH